jgi:hypothetical protein
MEMQSASSNREIIAKLAKLQADKEYIKQKMVDADSVLTSEESGIIEESLLELKEGKTTSHEKLKKERGYSV